LPKLQQTIWISTDEHRYPVKFEGGGIIGVLDTIRVNKPGEMVEYRDDKLGFSMAAPSEWYFVEGAIPRNEDAVIYHLLDPEAEAFSILMALPIEKLPDGPKPSPRALAEKIGIERLQKRKKNFKVRPDSWTERTISGHPGISFIADYIAREKKMTDYYVCSLGESTAVQFFTSIERDKFDDFQGSFDAIVDTYREKSE
jgi:hypothetical protein